MFFYSFDDIADTQSVLRCPNNKIPFSPHTRGRRGPGWFYILSAFNELSLIESHLFITLSDVTLA